MTVTAEKIIKTLGLEPLSFEGGYFKRTYLSKDIIGTENLPDRYRKIKYKNFCSAIYYLITSKTYSRIHRLPTDEIFHFYLGDPIEMIQINENKEINLIKIGNQILDGFTPQVIVPKGTWQGIKLIEGGEFALLGTTMSPAFDIEDFEEPKYKKGFLNKYPIEYEKLIKGFL